MKYPKRNTKLWIYLYQTGFLESKDEAVIKQAIKDYYKKYDRDLKQRKRKIEQREFTISFSTQLINHIRKRAKEYNVTVIDYLKILANADLSCTSPLEHTLTYKEILQVLQQYKNSIDAIESKESNKWFGNNNYDELKKLLQYILEMVEIKKR